MLAFLYDLFIIRFLCVFDWLLNTATSLLLLLRTIRQHLPLLLVGLQCVHTMEKGCSSWSFFHFFLLVRACSWVCGCLWVCVCLTVCVSVCFLGLLLCSFVKLLECCCHFSSSFHPHPYFPIGCLSCFSFLAVYGVLGFCVSVCVVCFCVRECMGMTVLDAVSLDFRLLLWGSWVFVIHNILARHFLGELQVLVGVNGRCGTLVVAF